VGVGVDVSIAVGVATPRGIGVCASAPSPRAIDDHTVTPAPTTPANVLHDFERMCLSR
jgi:hypothetical protein